MSADKRKARSILASASLFTQGTVADQVEAGLQYFYEVKDVLLKSESVPFQRDAALMKHLETHIPQKKVLGFQIFELLNNYRDDPSEDNAKALTDNRVIRDIASSGGDIHKNLPYAIKRGLTDMITAATKILEEASLSEDSEEAAHLDRIQSKVNTHIKGSNVSYASSRKDAQSAVQSSASKKSNSASSPSKKSKGTSSKSKTSPSKKASGGAASSKDPSAERPASKKSDSKKESSKKGTSSKKENSKKESSKKDSSKKSSSSKKSGSSKRESSSAKKEKKDKFVPESVDEIRKVYNDTMKIFKKVSNPEDYYFRDDQNKQLGHMEFDVAWKYALKKFDQRPLLKFWKSVEDYMANDSKKIVGVSSMKAFKERAKEFKDELKEGLTKLILPVGYESDGENEDD